MKRNTFDETSDPDQPVATTYRTYCCPASGCPNAASVSLDGGSRWACYFHAKAESRHWPATTQWIGENWPKAANWNHPEKAAHDAKQSAKRREALPAHPQASMGLSMADALSMATRS